MAIEDFKNLFHFNPGLAGYVGVERECFITDANGRVIPEAPRVLSGIAKGIYEGAWEGPIVHASGDEFGYELSACQIETRVGPCSIDRLHQELEKRQQTLDLALHHYGFKALHAEVGPADMPLDVYPDPTGRYQKITKHLPRDVLLAACRVAAVHIQIGMPNHLMALRVYNYVIGHLHELCELGNGSFGERLAIYRQMAPNYEPKPYRSWQEYYETALAQGFADDPRRCWTLIRISVHGTIEFRMFGATDSIPRIVSWATRCHELCTEALASV